MLRQVIFPVGNTVLLHLPDELVGKNVEIIAFATDDVSLGNIETETVKKRSIDEAISFYRANAVDFGKIEKWTREDLYE